MTTPPLPTYLVAIVAGPWHRVDTMHDGIGLGLLCTRSLARVLDAGEILAETARGLDLYQRYLDTAYPFTKYDQAFVPEFGSRGMENAACVTLGDDVLFRSRVTSDQRRSRAELILHELVHMWFGDLVTMRWWDDLWLNESFAVQLARSALAGTDHHGAAAAAFRFEKAAGFRQDALPTTHPVANDIANAEDAGLQLGGIAYTKGAVASPCRCPMRCFRASRSVRPPFAPWRRRSQDPARSRGFGGSCSKPPKSCRTRSARGPWTTLWRHDSAVARLDRVDLSGSERALEGAGCDLA